MSSLAAARVRREGGTIGVAEALRRGLRDFYRNSWRLMGANAALGVVLVLVAVASIAVHAAIVLFVLAGPLAAALVHGTVVLARNGNLTLAEVVAGLRLHWRRGLVLGAVGTGFGALAVYAIVFYSRSALALPLAFAAGYLVVALGIFQVLLWVLAIAEPSTRLRDAARDAAVTALRRPGATLLLTLVLLLVNLGAIAAAVMPFLTLSIAYSFLVASHFALPHPTSEDTF